MAVVAVCPRYKNVVVKCVFVFHFLTRTPRHYGQNSLVPQMRVTQGFSCVLRPPGEAGFSIRRRWLRFVRAVAHCLFGIKADYVAMTTDCYRARNWLDVLDGNN